MTIKRAETKTPRQSARGKKPLNADDSHWLKTRRALLRHVKLEVRRRLGSSHKDISDFTVRYERALKKSWSVSSQSQLIAQIEKANLVYGGDFHALAQAQRTHLRILRALKKPCTIALESFQVGAQKYLDLFLSGELSLDELRTKSKWDKNWGFAWDHYRPLLELAQTRGHELLALNSSAKDLASREERAAKILAKKLDRCDRLVYAIFGDLHLAPAHLPARVRKDVRPETRKRLRAITIHLNSERIYFQLAERGLEAKVDVVQFSDTSFCVLSTPPWVKWQSYLLFLDQAGRGEADRRLDDDTDFDPTDQVALLVRLAAEDFGLQKEFAQLNDLAVYGEDDETIWREISRRTKDGERETAQMFLKSGKRFFIPQGGIAYQPKPTINSAASLAGLYLHARLSKRTKTLWKFPDEMRALVWTEGVSYLISKMINHSRRSETVQGLQAKLEANAGNEEALRLALDFRLSEVLKLQTGRERSLQFQPRQKSSSHEASKILGGMLGERLFDAYRSRKLKKETLIAWMRIDPGSREFLKNYDQIIEKVARYSR